MAIVEANRQVAWESFADKTCLVCRAAVIKDTESGRFTVLATRLPGCVSEGDTVSEAIENIREAFIGAVESYRELGIDIPWENVQFEERPEIVVELLVVIDG